MCAFDSLKWKCSKGHCFISLKESACQQSASWGRWCWCGLWETQSAEGRCWQWHAEDRQPNQGQTLHDILKLSLNLVHLAWTHCSVLKVSSEPVFPHRCTSLARWAGSWRWTVCVWGSVLGSASGCWEWTGQERPQPSKCWLEMRAQQGERPLFRDTGATFRPALMCYQISKSSLSSSSFSLFGQNIEYSISQKWVHPLHFCQYFIISFHVTTLKKWHFATM